MQKQLISKPIIVMILTIICTSCLSIRPGAVRSGKHLYITYASAKGGTTYYIKPLDFYHQTVQGSIALDFTFRYTNVLNDTASLKFFLYDQAVIKKIDSVKIESGSSSIICKEVTHMFSDRTNKQYANRFELLIPLESLREAFNKAQWNYIVYKEGKEQRYSGSNKTDKNIVRLKKSVFDVL